MQDCLRHLPDMPLVGLSRDELMSESKSAILHITSAKIYFLSRARNAWHSIPSRQYFDRCMHASLESAKSEAERLRGRGNVFYIDTLPALRVDLRRWSFLVTEVNSQEPLRRYSIETDWKSLLKVGSSLGKFIASTEPFIGVRKTEKVIFLRIEKATWLPSLEEDDPLPRRKSFARGTAHKLSWDSSNYVISSASIMRLSGI